MTNDYSPADYAHALDASSRNLASLIAWALVSGTDQEKENALAAIARGYRSEVELATARSSLRMARSYVVNSALQMPVNKELDAEIERVLSGTYPYPPSPTSSGWTE